MLWRRQKPLTPTEIRNHSVQSLACHYPDYAVAAYVKGMRVSVSQMSYTVLVTANCTLIVELGYLYLWKVMYGLLCCEHVASLLACSTQFRKKEKTLDIILSRLFAFVQLGGKRKVRMQCTEHGVCFVCLKFLCEHFLFQ
jgi:hypothetical protein